MMTLLDHPCALLPLLLATPVVRGAVCRLLDDLSAVTNRLGLLLLSLISQTPCDEATGKAIKKLRRATDERVWFGCSAFMATLISLMVVNFLLAAWRQPSPFDGLLIVVLCLYLLLIYYLLFMLQAAAYGVKLPDTAQSVPALAFPRLRMVFSQVDVRIPTPPPKPIC